MTTFWLCLSVVMICAAVQQYKQATCLEAKEAFGLHGVFKHQSICVLMEMNENPICAKDMEHLCCNNPEKKIQ